MAIGLEHIHMYLGLFWSNLIGEEFMWDCFVNSQVIATQRFTQHPQSWKVQKSALGQNGKSMSFAEQNQSSKASNI